MQAKTQNRAQNPLEQYQLAFSNKPNQRGPRSQPSTVSTVRGFSNRRLLQVVRPCPGSFPIRPPMVYLSLTEPTSRISHPVKSKSSQNLHIRDRTWEHLHSVSLGIMFQATLRIDPASSPVVGADEYNPDRRRIRIG